MGLRGKTLVIWAALVAVGLLAASPFLCRDLVGTGEAYNYSLAIGDAVQQVRHGDVPPLVGQTELAFNGRVHPLRNAPYLFYLAVAIDAVTRHQLTPWQLQNASLVYSIIGAVILFYAGLRWATGCSQLMALLLASTYGLSAPLLCAANQLDLFMTVHAAMFAPFALAACIRGCRQPSFSTDAWLAAALASTWLAHPPVAVWVTFCVVVIWGVHFVLKPSWRDLARAVCATVIFGLLSCFVFASVATLNADLGFFADPTVFKPFLVSLMASVHNAFLPSLLPVTRSASATGDLQFGYVPWILTLGAVYFAFRMRRRVDAVAAVVLSLACLLLVMVIPIPVVTPLLWRMVPISVLTLTTEWPMQRLYLVALMLGLYGVGLVGPKVLTEWRRPRWALPLLMLLGVSWTAYQSSAFIKRGYADRRSHAETEAIYKPSNLNLTVTSYAFLGLAPTYNHGVVDPSMEFRILQDGRDEVSSNLSAAFSSSPIVGRGQISVQRGTPGTSMSVPIVLQPRHRYLITFDFRTPPLKGYLAILGSTLQRYYGLPESGLSRGFGMLDGQRKALPIWTDLSKPETILVEIVADAGTILPKGSPVVADYSLQDIDTKALPIQLQGFLPMRFTVDQPLPECTVETPIRYISGYRATVNGFEVTPLLSPTRQLMVPIPSGHSVVEIRFVGSRLARLAFWICLGSWLVFWIWRFIGSPVPARALDRTVAGCSAAWDLACRHGALLAAVAAGILFLAFLERQKKEHAADLAAVGPMKIDFKLPYMQLGINQPLLKTGKLGAGTIVFADIIDGQHIRIGADVWGGLYQSAVLPVDFFKVQSIVISDSALYPLTNPAVQTLSTDDRERLRGELRVELNGKIVIQERCFAYESKLSEIEVGHASMGSTTGPDFLGEIEGYRRLAVPKRTALPAGYQGTFRIVFPALIVGQSQPLFTVVCEGQQLTCLVTETSSGRGRIRVRAKDGFETSSDELDLGGSGEHVLNFQPQKGDSASGHPNLSLIFDGRPILGSRSLEQPTAPALVIPGLDQNLNADVDVRFTGSLSPLELESNAAANSESEPQSALHLVLSFPVDKAGRHEPILTTGHTGVGDLVYVVYEDATHIRLGVDHWGSSGGLSDPIAVDYLLPHEMWIRSGALYPQATDDAAWGGASPSEQEALKSKIDVYLDGTHVLSVPKEAHPSLPDEITVGKNLIGMSTADTEFSGRIEMAERTQLPPDASLPRN